MKITTQVGPNHYQVDLSTPLSISIDLIFNNIGQQPNHFDANAAIATPMSVDSFVGNTRRGGSCNVNVLQMNPHCNGTHTETIAHICNYGNTTEDGQVPLISDITFPPLMPCALITVVPVEASSVNEHYTPPFRQPDQVITASLLSQALEGFKAEQLTALVVRTLPNTDAKTHAVYNRHHQPPFFTHEAIDYLNRCGVQHIVVDVPSLDRLQDAGLLSNHRRFWNLPTGVTHMSPSAWSHKTITEMAFIPETVADGFYLLNMQTPALVTDAAPSRLVLYPVTPISDSVTIGSEKGR